MPMGWVIAGAIVVVLLLLGWLLRPRPPSAGEARRQLQQQREHLEAKFFQAAAASGKPRGLRWKECEWEGPVELARDRRTGQLAALVGVTIAFEAVEGSDMEGLPAVGNLRNASALFVHDGNRWVATGRALFNLNPDEVLQRFSQQYERVEASP